MTAGKQEDEPRDQAASLAAEVRAYDVAGARGAQRWELPVESAVALRCNGEDLAVLMATPRDLEALALGFALSEALIARAQDLLGVGVEERPAGLLLDLRVRPAALARQALRRRRFAARSGCGICGVQDLDQAVRPARPVSRSFTLEPAAVLSAFRQLPEHQPINRCNRSVHAAGWCRPDGTLELAREDVGRHNALDKLIGELARQGRDLAGGFAVLSSRCSFELVQKAAAVGIPALASLSAPTSLALSLAGQAGLQLAAHCRDGVVLVDPPAESPQPGANR